MCMQRGEQPGAARAENQNVGAEPLNIHAWVLEVIAFSIPLIPAEAGVQGPLCTNVVLCGPWVLACAGTSGQVAATRPRQNMVWNTPARKTKAASAAAVPAAIASHFWPLSQGKFSSTSSR